VRCFFYSSIWSPKSENSTSPDADIYSGIVRTLASICFSSTVGRWVDQNPDRLKTLLSTISVNRFAVIAASMLWFFIVDPGNGDPEGTTSGSLFHGTPISLVVKGAIFAFILLLGILENLSASGNMLSMERDWVVTAAASDGRPYDLTRLNSTMRRIDLICKLIAPILISVIISATSTRIGVLVVAGMSTSSWTLEVLCARRAWNQNPKLKATKSAEPVHTAHVRDLRLRSCWPGIFEVLTYYFQDFKRYFSSNVWIPSLALALLHISALAYSATFITFLLNVGFSLDLITVARAAGSVVEISSTVVTPVGVQYLGKAQHHGRFRREIRSNEDSEAALLENGSRDVEGTTETGLERLGLWGISWQLLNLVSRIPQTLSCPTLMVHRCR
jgi:iron-regulated transporter 1